MRQIAVDMLSQMAVLGGTVALLIYNFQMKGPPPAITLSRRRLIPIAIVLFAFISPYITERWRTACAMSRATCRRRCSPNGPRHRCDAISGRNPDHGG
jgi:hypothetical protein